jgi:hypothetical protein
MQWRQRRSPFFVASGIIEIVVEQTTPTALDADYFDTGFGTAVHNCLNGWVQAWDVAAASQNTYAHRKPPSLSNKSVYR